MPSTIALWERSLTEAQAACMDRTSSGQPYPRMVRIDWRYGMTMLGTSREYPYRACNGAMGQARLESCHAACFDTNGMSWGAWQQQREARMRRSLLMRHLHTTFGDDECSQQS